MSTDINPAQEAFGVAPSWWRRLSHTLGKLYSRPVTAVGTTITILFVLVALLGPLIAPYGENEIIASEARQPPSVDHWFGTDNLGRDVFSRVILGAYNL